MSKAHSYQIDGYPVPRITWAICRLFKDCWRMSPNNSFELIELPNAPRDRIYTAFGYVLATKNDKKLFDELVQTLGLQAH